MGVIWELSFLSSVWMFICTILLLCITFRTEHIPWKSGFVTHENMFPVSCQSTTNGRLGEGEQRGLAYDEVNRTAAARRRKCTEVSVAAWLVGDVNVWQTTFATRGTERHACTVYCYCTLFWNNCILWLFCKGNWCEKLVLCKLNYCVSNVSITLTALHNIDWNTCTREVLL